LRCILSGDTALDGEAALGDSLLCKTKLRKSRARSNLDLCGDDVDTSDLLFSVMSFLSESGELEDNLPVMVCSTWIRGLISMK
jgi:hypothetical protein